MKLKTKILIAMVGIFLEVQWLRVCLPMQGTWVWSLVHEDSTCCGTTNLSAVITECTSIYTSVHFSSVQLLSHVWFFVTPWIAACQASLSITNSWSSPRLTCIKSIMPSSHLILCRPLLLLPPIPPNIRVFSNESTLCMIINMITQMALFQSFLWLSKFPLYIIYICIYTHTISSLSIYLSMDTWIVFMSWLGY